ncbi:DUF2793 domain-containing protein [Phyllobacterium sp. A18/5-2]|uniref:DUF2793 domain-containing protein n=1 Tax=Phyllobacterium sp. A18/5-2 TaxID=2978392 RepID=UPI0021C75903|nr:DUF2793 domain-containing protein [Phyllobacterium sp. A18/5-2]UXN63382.1 DUF2793 domain-containing protein [Phyllobacterium sp. A18/5-2]
MEQTSNLKLPYIAPSQAQKHVTHNEAIRALDALVQLSVAGRNAAEPPAEPQEGARYIVASAASGQWSGKDNQVAAWQDGAWAFFEPQEGWYAWVMEERTFAVFSQAAWSGAKAGTNPVPAVGINTIADETNRLALKSPASLFDHAGQSHQLKINKADDNQAASLLFQSNYQGCAEMGTMWGRDFRDQDQRRRRPMARCLGRRQRQRVGAVSRRHCQRRHRQEAIRPDFRARHRDGSHHLSNGGQPESHNRQARIGCLGYPDLYD